MKRIVIIAAAWAAFLCPAQAQIPGQFPPGAIYGNPGGAQAPPRAALPGDFGIQLASITSPQTFSPAMPGSIGAGLSYVSNCYTATANDRIDFTVTLSQTGTIKINRYLGAGCTIPIPGGPIQRTVTAATPGVVSASDGAALRGYTVEINNTAGSSSTVTNSALLQTTSSTITGNPAYSDAFGNQSQPVTPLCGSGMPCAQNNPSYTIVSAGELHLGEIGQNQLTISTTVPATAVTYASGTSIGGKLTMVGFARGVASGGNPATGGQILSTVLQMRETSGTGPIDIYYFDSDLTGVSACTNNAAFQLGTSDGPKVIGISHLTDATAAPGPSANTGTMIFQLAGFPMPYSLTNTTTVYACIVARGSIVNAVTGGVTLKVQVLRQ